MAPVRGCSSREPSRLRCSKAEADSGKEAALPRPAIITDFSCTPRICGPLLEELWPNEPDRPAIAAIPVSSAGSANHEAWVSQYRADHDGNFLGPFLADRGIAEGGDIALVGFSAGGWGIGEILKDPSDAAKVGLVYIVDGLHGRWTSAQPGVSERLTGASSVSVQVGEHWLATARRAAGSELSMLVSYSRILPPTYPGTRETALAIVAATGASTVDVDIGLDCEEAHAVGSLALCGFSPPSVAPDGPEAHIYQANEVQEAMWKAAIEPWSRGIGMGASGTFGADSNQLLSKLLFIIGAASGFYIGLRLAQKVFL